MAASVAVVGSGASGVHAAQSLLERGCEVTMLDVGRRGPEPVLPQASVRALKRELDRPLAYFLGARGEGVVYPSEAQHLYGFPPSKSHVFAPVDGFPFSAEGFDPLVSFAQGGLAEAWTGGSYTFTDADLAGSPLAGGVLDPYYALVARRIGVAGAQDDLHRFSPLPDYAEPTELDGHAALLVRRYERRRSRLNARGVFLGRSRVAVSGCTSLGRCFWGCPTGAFWTPSVTLARLREHPRFRYAPDRPVRRIDGRRLVTDDGSSLEADALVLAAGTLGTARIVLESLDGAERLPGLMDNRHLMLPFSTPSRLGAEPEQERYQYHQLALAIENADARANVHVQVTTLKAAAIHPLADSLPCDLRTGIRLVRSLHGALGVANVWLSETRRDGNYLALRNGTLVAHYDDGDDADRVAEAARAVRRALRTLGSVVPPGMTRVLPRGSAVHYGGTLPMTADGGPLTCTPEGRLRAFENVYVVDGSWLPFLPAKNATLTLMANAARVADLI